MTVAFAGLGAAEQRLAGFRRLHASLLWPLRQVEIDLYELGPSHPAPVLLAAKGLPLSNEKIRSFIGDGTRMLLVRAGDYGGLSEQLLRSVAHLMANEAIPQAERFALMQTAAAAEVRRACSLLGPGPYVEVSKKIGAAVVSMLNAGQIVPEQVFRVAGHDYHTFVHVTNVACYAVMLAIGLGVRETGELERLAIGAALHDLGKRSVPAEILRKPTRLNAGERRVVEQHPTLGYREVATLGDVDHDQRMMVYQHHEHVAGGGYPVAIAGEEINPWARLLAVVDVFDALTGRRPYRDPAGPRQALAVLQSRAGEHFDKEMVRCWASIMRRA